MSDYFLSVLVLSPAWRPHRIVPARRALWLVEAGKAEVVQGGEARLYSAHRAHAVPSVIVLRVRLPAAAYRPLVAWSRHAVLERDNWTCSYCGARGADTVDHIIPRCHWTRPDSPNQWENSATACAACNARKGGRSLAEAGMRFRPGFRPYVPNVHPRWARQASARPEWARYFG